MKKLALFVATEKGHASLLALIESGNASNIGFVVTFKEANAEQFYQRIELLCTQNHIHFYLWKDIKKDIHSLFYKHAITSAIAISWIYLLPLSINEILQDDLIVFHDSLLPKYRGFAPTPTAIMCGDDMVGVSVLFASEEVDKGPIILQKKTFISKQEYCKEIIGKIASLYAEAIVEVLELIMQGMLRAVEQDEAKATYSIWRSLEDCHIDWTWSAERIYNFVRAVSFPYPGAFSMIHDEKVIVHRTEIADDMNFVLRDSGKIWSIQNGKPLVICGEGMIRILSATTSDGTPFTFSKLRIRLQ